MTPPAHSGFGSRMIERTFAREDGGRAEIVFDPEGVSCSISTRLLDTNNTFESGTAPV